MLKRQRALGWETFHITSPKHGAGASREEEVDGWLFHRVPSSHSILDGIPGLTEIELMGEITWRIEQLARRVKPHVLHAHSPVLNAIPALRVGRRLGIPVVYELRALWEDAAVDRGATREGSLRYRVSRALETWALRQADAVTTVGEGLRSEIVGRGVTPSKITVVPNAIDIGEFSTDAVPDFLLKQRLGLEGALVLGFIGSFGKYEGLAVLLRAVRSLVDRGERVRALLVGSGLQEVELKQLSSDLGIEEQVVFLGCVPHEEVGRYFDLIDILVYPRLPMRFNELVSPIEPLEAMARGRLVLGSDVGGHRELIRPGETGELFRAGDPEALAAAVLCLQKDSGRWPQLRDAARKFVETERNWDASIARYVDVYERVVGQGFRS